MNMEHEKEEESNPEKSQRRMQDDDCKKINVFIGHTSATVSAGAHTISAVVLDSVVVLVHESLPDFTDRVEDRLCLDQKSTKFVCLSVLFSPSLTPSLPPCLGCICTRRVGEMFGGKMRQRRWCTHVTWTSTYCVKENRRYQGVLQKKTAPDNQVS